MSKDKTIDELRQEHAAAFDMFRAKELQFELSRAEVLAQRERLNRIRKLREENEAAAQEAREACRVEMMASDGEMTDAMKEKRRSFRDAETSAEDYRDLEGAALKALERVELPALRNAKEMRGAQRLALRSLAELEMRELIAKAAPEFARITRLRHAALTSDPSHPYNATMIEEPIEDIMRALRSAATGVDIDAIKMPVDLIERGNIAPLSWKDVESVAALRKRAEALEQAPVIGER